VSVPVAKGAKSAATAAAEPPDEPPGTWSSAHGLLVAPTYELSEVEPIANSSMFTLPKVTRPAALVFSTTVAS